MTLLPATVSNNVPGTEYSLGSDTCLNELVKYCDVVKESAASSRKRVFVIETQGGKCGYIATLAALNSGAISVYTPEEKLTIEILASDISHLKEVMMKDRGQNRTGRVILMSQEASRVHNAESISNMIEEEAGKAFESRHSIPGHFVQGLTPSPMDRIRAVRMAFKCMEELEMAHELKTDDPRRSSVIGLQGPSVVFTPMERLERDEETDWKNRRSRKAPFLELKPIIDMLGGRKKRC